MYCSREDSLYLQYKFKNEINWFFIIYRSENQNTQDLETPQICALNDNLKWLGQSFFRYSISYGIDLSTA